MRQFSKGHRDEPPVLLVKWYDVTRWLLDRVDAFPKNQRFIFGQRLADRAMNILEVLVEAAYSHRKANLLARANRDIEILRWLVRMATDRKVLTPRQYEHCCLSLAECGRMVGGWWKQAAAKERAGDAPREEPV
ncbi:MAG: diversity-generating retroelement protein Avd [Planctomycetota bacterium]|nr:diversity-generating retroelement protein Avd [Planctomycetota bacterium]